MSEQPNGSEPFMTVREMVMEIRADLKSLSATVADRSEIEDHEQRIQTLESTRLRVAGAWTAVTLIMATLAGLSGLVISAYALIV